MQTPGYATSSPIAPPEAAPLATPSSSESPGTTGSAERLGILAGMPEGWAPGSMEEAQEAVGAVAAYCRDYCPARLACVEEACRIYRLESSALEALGYRRDADTEAVGVQSQPITGLAL